MNKQLRTGVTQGASTGPLDTIGRILNLVLFPFLAIWKMVGPVLGAIWDLTVWLFYAPLHALLASPLGTWMRAKTHARDPITHLAQQAARLVQRERHQAERSQAKTGEEPELEQRIAWHMALGEREQAARLIVPPEQYPTMWTRLPTDLRRNLVQDGRLPTGEAPATRLAGSTLTADYVARAWASSTVVAARAGWIILVALTLLSVLYAATIGSSQFERANARFEAAAQGRDAAVMDSRAVAERFQDVWNEADVQRYAELSKQVRPEDHAASVGGKAQAIVEALATFVGLLLGTIVLSIAFGRYIWIGRLRWLAYAAADAGVAGLRQSWREALQRWRWRLEQREVEGDAYADQVRFATEIDRSPLIHLGESLGELEFRGHLLAPPQGTPIRMSVVDLLQHVQVLGGSGEGKSRNFYVPLVRQLLQLRAQGYPLAIYATDDKGAIGADIIEEARAAGVPDSDVLAIGTRPGEWRVDLLEGLEPAEFADIVRSVSAQAGGDGAGDDFWPSMASDLLLNVATVLQAAEMTDSGFEWVRREGKRMYSIVNILRTASSDDLTQQALQIVLDALQDKGGQYRYIAHLDKTGLHAAIDYLVGSWLTMVDATRDGIRANARKALRGFAFNEAIATGYADGSGEKLLPASQLLANKVKIIQISQIEHGSAGRMVCIMLKTLFFKLARAREQADPSSAKARLSWWFNPRPSALTPKLADALAINVFLADEYQALVTASRDDGLSDASVWNVLRSAGVAGVLLSQSVSAYAQAVGDKAADNMRSNWRTLILLRTEDTATIETAQRLAGKVMRFHSADWGHLESSVAVRRETGVDAERLAPSRWRGEFESVPALLQPGHFHAFAFPGYENAFGLDTRFIPHASTATGTQNNAAAEQAALQAAHWRQEDLGRQALQFGVSEVDAVRAEDIMQMGRARALVFVQRAGGTRVEFVKLGS